MTNNEQGIMNSKILAAISLKKETRPGQGRVEGGILGRFLLLSAGYRVRRH